MLPEDFYPYWPPSFEPSNSEEMFLWHDSRELNELLSSIELEGIQAVIKVDRLANVVQKQDLGSCSEDLIQQASPLRQQPWEIINNSLNPQESTLSNLWKKFINPIINFFFIQTLPSYDALTKLTALMSKRDSLPNKECLQILQSPVNQSPVDSKIIFNLFELTIEDINIQILNSLDIRSLGKMARTFSTMRTLVNKIFILDASREPPFITQTYEVAYFKENERMVTAGNLYGYIYPTAVKYCIGNEQIVTSLKIYHLSDEHQLDLVKRFPNIRHLDLSESFIDMTHERLVHLSQLIHVEYLGLALRGNIKSGLGSIFKMKNLKGLNLNSCECLEDLENSLLKRLSELKNLEVLILRRLKSLTVNNFAVLSELNNLKSFTLDFESGSPEVVRPSEEGIALLGKLTNLEKLHLKYCDLNDSKITFLSSLNKLQSLDVSNNQITDAALVQIGKINSLSSLSLEGCLQITNDGVVNIIELTNLKNLNLASVIQLTNDGFPHLKGLKSLESLRLCRKFLLTDENLKQLKLRGVKIS